MNPNASRYEQVMSRINADPMFSMVNFRRPAFIGFRPFVSVTTSQKQAQEMTPYELMKTLEAAGVY